MGDCQNYGPFLGPYYDTGPNTGPNLGDPKRDHNFDNPPCTSRRLPRHTPLEEKLRWWHECNLGAGFEVDRVVGLGDLWARALTDEKVEMFMTFHKRPTYLLSKL